VLIGSEKVTADCDIGVEMRCNDTWAAQTHRRTDTISAATTELVY